MAISMLTTTINQLTQQPIRTVIQHRQECQVLVRLRTHNILNINRTLSFPTDRRVRQALLTVTIIMVMVINQQVCMPSRTIEHDRNRIDSLKII
jgi:hypothetical protein